MKNYFFRLLFSNSKILKRKNKNWTFYLEGQFLYVLLTKYTIFEPIDTIIMYCKGLSNINGISNKTFPIWKRDKGKGNLFGNTLETFKNLMLIVTR